MSVLDVVDEKVWLDLERSSGTWPAQAEKQPKWVVNTSLGYVHPLNPSYGNWLL